MAAGCADSQRCNNAWPRCAALVETVHPVRTLSRHASGIDGAILIDRAAASATAPTVVKNNNLTVQLDIQYRRSDRQLDNIGALTFVVACLT